MLTPADVLTRIEGSNRTNGGGVLAGHRQGGYTLLLEATGVLIAQLKPTGRDDRMNVLSWSHHGEWAETSPLGGTILPVNDALAVIARAPLFWSWV